MNIVYIFTDSYQSKPHNYRPFLYFKLRNWEFLPAIVFIRTIFLQEAVYPQGAGIFCIGQ